VRGKRRNLIMMRSDRPGWHDDPCDPNAQNYFDGMDCTSQNQCDPPLSAFEPDSCSGARTGHKAAVWTVAAAVALFVPVGCGSHSPPSPSPGSQQSGSSSGRPGSSGTSSYYQQGYNSGTSGLARNGYGFNQQFTGATVTEKVHAACADAINNEPNSSSLMDPAAQDAYMDGCRKAFADHPPPKNR
jgi:hypothetical protein